MRDSIFYAAFRAFFVSFAVIIGLCFAFFALALVIGAVGSESPESKLTTVYTQEILPNAKGHREVLSSTTPAILQIDISGIIGMDDLTLKTIRQQLVESREGDFKDSRIKGILLYINSPGGTVTDANGIFAELMDYKKKYNIPVYAFVDGLCASGGMYIALAADKIYATDVSLVGSVGVLIPTFMNVTKLLDKIGVETITVTAGKDKDAMNPLRAWKPGEDENFKQIVDYYYLQFVDLMAKHRPDLSKEKLVKDYGAHVFPANQAQEYGYIDVSGANLEGALTDLVKASGITDDNYQVIRLENKFWWKSLFSSQSSALFTGKIVHQLSISPTVDVMLKNECLYLYSPK